MFSYPFRAFLVSQISPCRTPEKGISTAPIPIYRVLQDDVEEELVLDSGEDEGDCGDGDLLLR